MQNAKLIYTCILTTYIRMVKISSLYIKQSQHDTVSRHCTCTVILYSVCVPVCAVRVYVSVLQCVHTCVHAVPFKMLSVLQQARKELFCNPGSPNCEVPQGAGTRGWGLSDVQMHSDVCETSGPAPPTCIRLWWQWMINTSSSLHA